MLRLIDIAAPPLADEGEALAAEMDPGLRRGDTVGEGTTVTQAPYLTLQPALT